MSLLAVADVTFIPGLELDRLRDMQIRRDFQLYSVSPTSKLSSSTRHARREIVGLGSLHFARYKDAKR